jgi:hypothetical protein
MATDTLAALQPLLTQEIFNLLQSEVEALQATQADPNTVFQEAVEKLRAENKIIPELADRLSLAITIAKISGNNHALVKAVDDSNLVQNVRDFAVHFDTAAIESVISAEPPKPGDAPASRLPNGEKDANAIAQKPQGLFGWPSSGVNPLQPCREW